MNVENITTFNTCYFCFVLHFVHLELHLVTGLSASNDEKNDICEKYMNLALITQTIGSLSSDILFCLKQKNPTAQC